MTLQQLLLTSWLLVLSTSPSRSWYVQSVPSVSEYRARPIVTEQEDEEERPQQQYADDGIRRLINSGIISRNDPMYQRLLDLFLKEEVFRAPKATTGGVGGGPGGGSVAGIAAAAAAAAGMERSLFEDDPLLSWNPDNFPRRYRHNYYGPMDLIKKRQDQQQQQQQQHQQWHLQTMPSRPLMYPDNAAIWPQEKKHLRSSSHQMKELQKLHFQRMRRGN